MFLLATWCHAAQQPQLPQFPAVVTCHPVKTLGTLWNKKLNCWAAEIQYQARIGKHFTFKTSPIAPLSSLKLKDNTVKRRRGAAEFLKTPQSQHFVGFFFPNEEEIFPSTIIFFNFPFLPFSIWGFIWFANDCVPFLFSFSQSLSSKWSRRRQFTYGIIPASNTTKPESTNKEMLSRGKPV